ncbi:MAG: M28 family metallopeptidase [Flavobacteriales bacterium]
MRLALSLVFCLQLFSGFGQQYPYREIISTLCSPAYSGRGYVANGGPLAAQLIASEFQKIGLKPFKSAYQQSFTLPVQTFPGACTFVLGKDTLVPGKDYLVDPSSAGAAPTNYQLIYCNAATLYRSVNAFKPCPKDRILVVQTFGYGGDTNKIIQTRLQELKRFAATIELSDKKLTWSVSQTASLYPAFQVLASSFITRPQTAFIFLESQFIPNFKSSNVIGYLPAAQKAAKQPYIVLTAHYDHLGKMGSATYFPGANDNASGVGMLLYLAEQLSKKRNPNFNYVFIAFGAEEAGLVGSQHFVEHPLFDLKKIRFLLNTDIMGSGEEGITVVNATLFKPEFDRLTELNQEGKYLAQVKSRGPAANSDHYFFTEKGVPAFFIYTMGPNKHYHDIEDKAQELSYAAFEPLAQLLLNFVRSF